MTFENDLYPAFPFVWAGFAFYIGAMAAGGFGCLNYRLPVAMGAIFTQKVKETADKPSPPSIWSVCDSCHAPLGWRGVLPIVGWIASRGRCQDCGSRVPAVYPIMEFCTGLIAVVTLLVTMHPALVIVALWLVMIGWLDHDATWIPDGFTIPLGLSALLASWFGIIPVSLFMVILGAMMGGVMMFVSQYAHFRICEEENAIRLVPMGDVTLMAALGAWTGPLGAVVVSLVSALLMAVYVPLFCRGRDHDHGYPFGPTLCAAGLAGIIFESSSHQSLWDTFMSLVG